MKIPFGIALILGILSTNSYAIFDFFYDSYYMGAQPYDQYGSSYYTNVRTDYYWDGQRWIFNNGYKTPKLDCAKLPKKCRISKKRGNT